MQRYGKIRYAANNSVTIFAQKKKNRAKVIQFPTYQEIKNVKYPKIDLCIQEINVKIDQNIVMNLIGLIKNYTSKLIFLQMENNALAEKAEEEEKLLNEIKIPTEELKKETKNSNKILINHIFLSAMKINLSFKLELSSINITYLPKFMSRIIGSLGSSLVSISDSPLKFSEIIIENIYLCLIKCLIPKNAKNS